MKAEARILHIFIAIGLVALAGLLYYLEDDGPMVIALILGGTSFIYGIQSLIAYFTKFRCMVGGRLQLYLGIITMDMGLMIIGSYNESTFLILIYLLGIRAVTGIIDIARALESRRNGGGWKVKLVSGIITMITVILGIVYFKSPDTVVDTYCIGLLTSAVEHLIAAFRKTKIVTIA